MMETLGRILHDAAPPLLALFARGALLLVAAAIGVRLLRHRSAAVRHLVWASALAALLILPVASLLVPAIALPILPPRLAERSAPPVPVPTGGMGSLAAPPAAPDDALPAAEREADARPAPAVVPPPRPASSDGPDAIGADAWTWRAVAVAIWALVALVLLAEVGRSRLRLRRLSAGAWRIHDPVWWRAAARIGASLGLRRSVTLLATARTRVPLTWGTRAPIVLLPAHAHRWPAERREAVLVHELAHVARGDALGHDIARVAAALFWINPLVWAAVRGMRAERERACDDLVLATGTRASSYAGDLLEIARAVAGRSQRAAAALAMARPTELEGRLLAILDPAIPRRPVSRAARTGAAVLALTMVVPLGALRPAERMDAMATSMDTAGVSAARLTKSEPLVTPGGSGPIQDLVESRDDDHAIAAEIPAVGDVPLRPAAIDGTDPALALDLRVLGVPGSDTPSVAALSPTTTAAADGGDSLETLIAVAWAAASFSSDNDKAELLLSVLRHGVRDDSLHRVVLRAASTITSGHDRSRVMLAMLRNGLAATTEVQFLATAEGLAGSYDRSVVLTAFARTDGLGEHAVRAAFLKAVATLSGDYERSQLLKLIIGLPSFDAASALAVLPSIRTVGSSHEQANLLVAIAKHRVAQDPDVREALLLAAGSVSSAYDYRRVMQAAGISDERRPR